jgi:small-conductance mechanosensitive channel
MSGWFELAWADLGDFISPPTFLLIVRTLANIALIWIGSRIVHRFATNLIERLLRIQDRTPGDPRRTKTLGALVQSMLRYLIYFIAGTMILQELGIETATILATAGLGGLAIGFGAQNLVKDVITGFFILLEDQFGVGDYITAAGHSGVVEEVGLRVTKLRDFGGELHIIPNGSIDKVTNHMGQGMRVLVRVTIPYEESLERTVAVLEGFFAEFAHPDLVDGPKLLGVSNLGESGVELLIWAKAKAMHQWAMERELRGGVMAALEGAGIKFGYPRRYLVWSTEQGGGLVGPQHKN